ncbi:MAG TPA: hypothetical protein PK691_01780 [Thermomicrobiales bacterium]|nr:hypothetical protein [Thermomicrobiales bacterium]
MSDTATIEAPTGATPAETQEPATPVDQLGEAGRKALEAERKARSDAEKKAAALQKQIDDAAAAKAKADADEAERKGEFEKLATDRAKVIETKNAELMTATQERDALQARLDAMEQAVIADMDAWIKDHKDAIPSYLTALNPGATASLAERQRWFKAAQGAVAEATQNPVGVPKTPQPAGSNDQDDEAARKAASQRNRARF